MSLQLTLVGFVTPPKLAAVKKSTSAKGTKSQQCMKVHGSIIFDWLAT